MNLETLIENTDSATLKQIDAELRLRIQSQMASHSELTQRSNILIAANLAAVAFITASSVSKTYFGIISIVFLAIGFGFAIASIIQQRIARPGLSGSWFLKIEANERSKIKKYRLLATNDAIKSNEVAILKRERICNASSIFLLIGGAIHFISMMYQAGAKH